jgi:hypothetical protein
MSKEPTTGNRDPEEIAQDAFDNALDAANAIINDVVAEAIKDLTEIGARPEEPAANVRHERDARGLHGMHVAALVLRFYPAPSGEYAALKPVSLYMIKADREKTLYITGGSVIMGEPLHTEDYGRFTTADIRAPTFRAELRAAFDRAIAAMRAIRPPR